MVQTSIRPSMTFNLLIEINKALRAMWVNLVMDLFSRKRSENLSHYYFLPTKMTSEPLQIIGVLESVTLTHRWRGTVRISAVLSAGWAFTRSHRRYLLPAGGE